MSRLHIMVGPALAEDLDDDQEITVADAVLALRSIAGLCPLTEAQQFAADLAPREGSNGRNVGDGIIDVADVVRILLRVVRLLTDEQWP